MELCTILIGLAVVAFLIYFALADADLILLWYEKFGRKSSDLAGKIVWITGASSGIGEYLAYDLAAVGCKLVLSARRENELERVKKKCILSGPLKDEDILVLPLDLLNFNEHATATKKVMDQFGKIDILVNNSGRSQRALAAKTDIDVDRQIMELNFTATVSLTKAVLPDMMERNQGHIVVTSSIAGKLGSPISASYSATKHALHGWFEGIRPEVSINNIDITMVCPGPVKSNITQFAFTEDPKKGYSGVAAEDATKKMPTSRCAHLMTVAMANKLDEVWISDQPILLFTYFSQYMPYLHKKLGKFVGKKMIKRYLANESPY